MYPVSIASAGKSQKQSMPACNTMRAFVEVRNSGMEIKPAALVAWMTSGSVFGEMTKAPPATAGSRICFTVSTIPALTNNVPPAWQCAVGLFISANSFHLSRIFQTGNQVSLRDYHREIFE